MHVKVLFNHPARTVEWSKGSQWNFVSVHEDVALRDIFIEHFKLD